MLSFLHSILVPLTFFKPLNLQPRTAPPPPIHPFHLVPLTLFKPLNLQPRTAPPPPTLPFNLTTTAITDLWRKPPSHIIANQPTFYTPVKLSEFRTASATFSAEFRDEYDQAGLVLMLPHEGKEHPAVWVKAGIEVVEGVTSASVVAATEGGWADWSVVPWQGMGMTVEMVREGAAGGVLGSSLRVYVSKVGSGREGRKVVREITWAFEEAFLKSDPVVWVGAYVAKPTVGPFDEAVVDVRFDGLEVVVERG